jgi:hypothetical protein
MCWARDCRRFCRGTSAMPTLRPCEATRSVKRNPRPEYPANRPAKATERRASGWSASSINSGREARVSMEKCTEQVISADRLMKIRPASAMGLRSGGTQACRATSSASMAGAIRMISASMSPNQGCRIGSAGEGNVSRPASKMATYSRQSAPTAWPDNTPRVFADVANSGSTSGLAAISGSQAQNHFASGAGKPACPLQR